MNSERTWLNHPAVQVEQKGTLRKMHHLTRLWNVGPVNSVFLFNNSFANVERAVLVRLIYEKIGPIRPAWMLETPQSHVFIRDINVPGIDGTTEDRDGIWYHPIQQPDSAFYFTQSSIFTRRLKRGLPKIVPLSLPEFLECYVGDRRYAVYKEAVESLALDPLWKGDARVKLFVKCEKTLLQTPYGGESRHGFKENPVPRTIHPRDPRFTASLGRFIKVMEPRIYSAIDHVFRAPTIMKGKNNLERGSLLAAAWEAQRDACIVRFDGSRFEAHISKSAIHWESGVYHSMVSGNDRSELRSLTAHQCNYQMEGRTTDGCVRLQQDHGRVTGDYTTGCSNSLQSAMLWWTWLRRANVKGRVFIDGDDGVIVLKAKDFPKLMEGLGDWFKGMGFVMSVSEPVFSLEEAKFCGCRPHFDGKVWIMVRDIRDALPKDSCTIIPLDSLNVYQRWLAAVGMGGLSLAGNVPVYCEFYNMFVRNSHGAKPLDDKALECGFTYQVKAMGKSALRYAEPTIESRCSFWRTYGLDAREQVDLENHFREMTLTWAPPQELNESPFECRYTMGTGALLGF